MTEDLRKAVIERLADYPTEVLNLALVYADRLITYGVDVTEKWETLTEQVAACDAAFIAGKISAIRGRIGSKEIKCPGACGQVCDRCKRETICKVAYDEN